MEIELALFKSMIVDVIIPAYNEEDSIGKVINDIPEGLVREVIVCNNNSKDKTREVAIAGGATVIDVPQMGYGSACLAGMEYITKKLKVPEVIVFIDGDYSDYPGEMPLLTECLKKTDSDLVIGSRALGNMERGSMQPQQIFGNWLATTLIKLIYNHRYTDLGPFRAVKYDSLMALDMEDTDFGWTVEMQVKAAKKGYKTQEVPVTYRRRIGISKISGTIKGTVLAGHKILWTIFKLL